MLLGASTNFLSPALASSQASWLPPTITPILLYPCQRILRGELSHSYCQFT